MTGARSPPAFVDTVIYVDVDGVLNVGVKDGNKGPLLLSDRNLAQAKRYVNGTTPSAENLSAEKIVDVSHHPAGTLDGETYAALVSDSNADVSDVLIARLVQLIRAAGDGCKVMLSSTWRLPKYAARRQKLEAVISKHYGGIFTFDGITNLVQENGAEARLQTIGDSIEDMCRVPGSVPHGLRVLVLEDFCIASLGVWSCNGTVMDSTETIEKYLSRRAPPELELNVKLVHTYDSWTTARGIPVQVGAGLTKVHFRRAMEFLRPGSESGDPSTTAIPPTHTSMPENLLRMRPCGVAANAAEPLQANRAGKKQRWLDFVAAHVTAPAFLVSSASMWGSSTVNCSRKVPEECTV